MSAGATVTVSRRDREATAFRVLAGISIAHLLNDTIQSIVPAIYPVLKESLALSFAQIGLLTLTLQLTASLLQPLVGLYTDRRPSPYALVVGMAFTLAGLLLLAGAPTYGAVLAAAGTMGIGSAVFHPESSRVARMASGGRLGLAQSLFQVGGNIGSSFGPLLAAFLIVPYGLRSIAWCSLLAVAAIGILWRIGGWYRDRHAVGSAATSQTGATSPAGISRRRVAWSIAILCALLFSKYVYLASISSYYTFYLITKFHLSVQRAQVDLFIFLLAVGIGTILGGPVGDRIGRKHVIWGSILGVFPFTLMLPYATLFWTPILTIVIGLILASAFAAIIVYAQELVPGRVGLISGVFFGFAFGVAGLGAAALGRLADAAGIELVYRVCAFLPAIGLLAAFLPNVDRT